MDSDARQQIVDVEQLRLLRFGYFITAGLTALVALFGLFYFLFIAFIFSTVARQAGGDAPPAFVGKLIGVFGLIFVFMAVLGAILQFLAGQRIHERRSRIFCMVIAGLTCLSIPYGTFLGVCTFIVLSRPTVTALFDQQPASDGPG